MEGSLAAGGAVEQFPYFRNILCLQRIPAGAKQVQGLTIHKEDRFLILVNDQLGQAVKILTGVLPNKGTVISFVLDNLGNLCHHATSFSLPIKPSWKPLV